jgi:mono/diheme cytochrome c family protein
VVASVLIALYSWFGIVRSRRFVTGESGLLLLAIAFIATGSMEFVREGIRKPYVIRPSDLPSGPQGLYSTGITPEEMRQAEKDGVLAMDPWSRDLAGGPPAERGRAIFTRMCSACHTADGQYNPVKPLVTGWDAAQYASNLSNLHATKEAMPHYQPTREDLLALTAYLRSLSQGQTPDEKFQAEVGRRADELRSRTRP